MLQELKEQKTRSKRLEEKNAELSSKIEAIQVSLVQMV